MSLNGFIQMLIVNAEARKGLIRTFITMIGDLKEYQKYGTKDYNDISGGIMQSISSQEVSIREKIRGLQILPALSHEKIAKFFTELIRGRIKIKAENELAVLKRILQRAGEEMKQKREGKIPVKYREGLSDGFVKFFNKEALTEIAPIMKDLNGVVRLNQVQTNLKERIVHPNSLLFTMEEEMGRAGKEEAIRTGDIPKGISNRLKDNKERGEELLAEVEKEIQLLQQTSTENKEGIAKFDSINSIIERVLTARV